MDTASDTLLSFTNRVHRLSPEVAAAYAAAWQPFRARRKELLTATGEEERYLYFVLDGVQRVYYLDELDREATLVFTYAPSFGGVLDSLLLQTPSAYYYETLTPSEFLRIPVSVLLQLMEQHRDIEALVRKGVTAATSGVLQRLCELQCFTAEQRYTNLLKRSPHILQLVPHKYLANYLGMDATNFSKLMNKVRI